MLVPRDLTRSPARKGFRHDNRIASAPGRTCAESALLRRRRAGGFYGLVVQLGHRPASGPGQRHRHRCFRALPGRHGYSAHSGRRRDDQQCGSHAEAGSVRQQLPVDAAFDGHSFASIRRPDVPRHHHRHADCHQFAPRRAVRPGLGTHHAGRTSLRCRAAAEQLYAIASRRPVIPQIDALVRVRDSGSDWPPIAYPIAATAVHDAGIDSAPEPSALLLAVCGIALWGCVCVGRYRRLLAAA